MRLSVLAVTAMALMGCQSIGQSFIGQPHFETAKLPPSVLAGPVIEVRIPTRGATATLARVGVNRDVETWLTKDNISLSFQQGVLVASRGLGFDLMGADASGTLAALAGRGAPAYRRHMRFLTGEHDSTWLMASCSMATVASDQPNLRLFEEQCTAHRNQFMNRYWLDDNGTIRRSRQWVAREIGYVETRLVAR